MTKNVIPVFNLPTTMVGETAVLDTVGGNTGQKKKSMRENKVKETKEGID